ncbi:hypothetical protein FOL47_003657 [Perkinsus chesapeaki]|uniref:Uncharacterized protein n=1 Tax=Perkinsus chesapeaki TaxID=330153 RepID=A0A7J6M708_PERCH|nr:hypothetical protein FOL47_003657 [Perkinsus chesapeaki]
MPLAWRSSHRHSAPHCSVDNVSERLVVAPADHPPSVVLDYNIDVIDDKKVPETRSRFTRWFSNLICGGRNTVYGSPSAYRPTLAPTQSRRPSLRADNRKKAPQVVRSVTFDGHKGAAAGDGPYGDFPVDGRAAPSRTFVPRISDRGLLKTSRSSIINSERSMTNRSLDCAPRNCHKEGRSYGVRETKEILRSMSKLADQRRLAGQHVYRHGRLVCAGVSKRDFEEAKIRIPLSKTHPWLAANYSCGGNITGTSSRTATTATPGSNCTEYPSPGTWATPVQNKLWKNDSTVINKTYNYPKVSKDVMRVDEMTLEEYERGFYRRNTM